MQSSQEDKPVLLTRSLDCCVADVVCFQLIIRKPNLLDSIIIQEMVYEWKNAYGHDKGVALYGAFFGEKNLAINEQMLIIAALVGMIVTKWADSAYIYYEVLRCNWSF